MVSATTMTISAAVSTASTRPAISTRARPSPATSAQIEQRPRPPRPVHAQVGGGLGLAAAGPSAPYVATWNDS